MGFPLNLDKADTKWSPLPTLQITWVFLPKRGRRTQGGHLCLRCKLHGFNSPRRQGGHRVDKSPYVANCIRFPPHAGKADTGWTPLPTLQIAWIFLPTQARRTQDGQISLRCKLHGISSPRRQGGHRLDTSAYAANCMDFPPDEGKADTGWTPLPTLQSAWIFLPTQTRRTQGGRLCLRCRLHGLWVVLPMQARRTQGGRLCLRCKLHGISSPRRQGGHRVDAYAYFADCMGCGLSSPRRQGRHRVDTFAFVADCMGFPPHAGKSDTGWTPLPTLQIAWVVGCPPHAGKADTGQGGHRVDTFAFVADCMGYPLHSGREVTWWKPLSAFRIAWAFLPTQAGRPQGLRLWLPFRLHGPSSPRRQDSQRVDASSCLVCMGFPPHAGRAATGYT
ncbi:hypothetical protein CHS0354_010234 [Potamilus streckersoni]|uniref:Uncharacterized protein n=1 Tax=Potamilus streckersoni TaxID=2493646 RepID=A0AAE0RSP1_9BIVA|nr:hypothetical protein CHS0354_010234 [Potamilus streckersoni]